MDAVTSKLSPQTVTFNFEPALPKLCVIKKENFFVKVFKKYFPDITAVIDWPCLTAIPFVQVIKKHIEPIKLYTMITAVAFLSISIIALTFISIPVVSQIFFIAAIASGTVSILIGGGFIKRYLHQKRMEEENTVLKNYQSAYTSATRNHVQNLKEQEILLQGQMNALTETNDRFHEANVTLEKNNTDLTSSIAEFSGQNETLKSTLDKNNLAAKALLKEKQVQIESFATRITQFNAEIESLQGSIANLRQEHAKTKEERENFERQNEKLAGTVSSLEASKAQIEEASEKVKNEAELLSRTNLEIQEQLVAHRKTIKEKELAYHSLEQSQEDLSESLAYNIKLRSTTIPMLEVKSKKLDTSLKQAKKILAHHENLVKEYNETLERQKVDLEKIKEVISTKADRLTLVRANLAAENEKLSMTRSEIERDTRKLNKVAFKLQKEVNRLSGVENKQNSA